MKIFWKSGINNLDHITNNNKLNSEVESKISKEASINIKPRLRMTTLYAIAQTMRIFGNRNWKSLRSNGSDIQLNGEIVAMTLIQLQTLQ